MGSLTPAALAVALLLPAGLASTPSVADTATDCVDPLELVACVEGGVAGSFECKPFDVNHVSCWANATWEYRGFTTLPAVVGGTAERAGGLNVDWCDPGGLCRGVGLGLLIVECAFGPGAPCGSSFSHSMWLGTPKIEPGQCIDFTFTVWILVVGDVSPGPANEAVKLLRGSQGPPLRATASPSVVDHVCN